MNTLDLLLALAGVPALAFSLYLLGLTLLSLGRPRPPRDAGGLHRFRIVVPAHDEERGIAQTLWNLRHLDYPLHRYQVVVVADNCTDGTAEVARGGGATVLERHDPSLRGKGHALAFAFRHLLAEPATAWDAAVVVDADSSVSPNLLRAISNRLAAGAPSVQAAYLPAPSAGKSLSLITEVAFTAFHVVRSTARERLGLSAGLRGNGMAFARPLLEQVPHDAFSRTEDLEFGIRLGLRGVRVAFAGEATVFGEMPERGDVAAVQRQRWMGGRMEIARAHLPALLAQALRRRSPVLADLAVDLLVPPLTLLAALILAGSAVAGAVALLGGSAALLPGAGGLALVVWLAAGLALVLHVADAARRAGRFRDLLAAPAALARYIFDKSLIAARSYGRTDPEWIRTARPGEAR